jgi:hypothetical protein
VRRRFAAAVMLVSCAGALGTTSSASAQRRRAEPLPPPPVTVELAAWPERAGDHPFRRVLSVRAHDAVELVADRRLLRLEVTPEGARRPLRCEHPDAPRRLSAERVRTLRPGERWAEWIDVREYCRGPALEALLAGAEARALLAAPRAARARPVLRVPGAAAVEHRELEAGVVRIAELPPLPERVARAPVRVVLADADLPRAGGNPTLRVRVLAREGTTRAYVRPDRLRFHVRGPDGSAECAMAPGGGAVPPELFQRLTTRAGPTLSLDASAYCPPGTFGAAGGYEVVPVLDLEHDGSRWGLAAEVGTFEGAPALVRARVDPRGYVERTPPEPSTPGRAS